MQNSIYLWDKFSRGISGLVVNPRVIGGFSPAILFANNEPGVWYDPSQAANLDWRRNLMRPSQPPLVSTGVWQQLNNATGTVSGEEVTITATGTSEVGWRTVQTLSVNTTYTISCEAKYGSSRYVFLRNLASGHNAWFDIQNGILATVNAGASASIELLDDGFYKCVLTSTTGGTISNNLVDFRQGSVDGNVVTSVVGQSTTFRRTQLEVGSAATEYQRITDVNTEVRERFPQATLFQDTAGTTPVTTPGQTVALMLDKSKGLTLGPELVTDPAAATLLGTGTWVDNEDGSFTFTDTVGGQSRPGVSFASSGINKTYEVRFTLVSASTTLRASGVSGGQTIFVSSPGDYKFVTTPTGFGGPIQFSIESTNTVIGSNFRLDNISVKELPGFHATQATTSWCPRYGIVPAGGRRNLLTFSEDPTNAAWVKNSVTATVDASVVTPLGNSSVRINALAGNANYYPQTVAVLNSFVTCWSVVRKGSSATTGNRFRIRNDTAFTNPLEFTVDYDTLEVTYLTGSSGATVTDLGDDWRLVVATASWTSGNVCRWNPGFSGQASAGTEFIYHSNSQIEPGSTATAYQKVTTQFDVTEAGVESLGYLSFDGIDDFMVTPTITPGIDKVQVFAGVRKLSDANFPVIVEHSVSTDTQEGASVLLASGGILSSAGYAFDSKGTLRRQTQTDFIFPSPITNILTGIGDIAGDTCTIRVDGTQLNSNIQDQGTGNFLAYPMYIGSRGGTSRRFNGHLHQLITRFGANLEVAQIESTEAYVAGKTAGVTL
jgi:hypothetical protein